MPVWVLFHQASHLPSGKVRDYIADHYLDDLVELRELSAAGAPGAPGADGALRALGGGTVVPALWDGSRLWEGAEAALAQLQRLTNIGRAP